MEEMNGHVYHPGSLTRGVSSEEVVVGIILPELLHCLDS